ncbi:MAG TPA: AIM24 family protein [Anaerolineales bacterium]
MAAMNPEGAAASAAPAARSYTCSWCGTVSDGTALSCPACGATLNVSEIVTPTGWVEAPGRKDMARVQFGKSSLQVEGLYVPVADFNLSAEDEVYFAHHVLLWKENSVTISMMSMKGAWKRAVAGMPVFMTQAKGPGHIAFSRDLPGELLALPLQVGHAVDVREHMMLVATHAVDYSWANSNIWFSTKHGDETETHFPLGAFLDRFSAPKTPGLLLLHAGGNVFVRRLNQGQSILIKPTALVFKDPTVSMQLHFEHPSTSWSLWGSYAQRYLWLRVQGPGRVAIQSAFEPVEDDGQTITGHSPATRQNW